MNTDIRISVSFKNHRKRKRLNLLLGDGAAGYLLDLWISTAMNRPSGDLKGMDEVDIALDAGWSGDPIEFCNALISCGWLEKNSVGEYRIHDWEEHQPYVLGAPMRSARAKHAARTRWDSKEDAPSMPEAYEEDAPSMPEVDSSNAPSPSPDPSPDPSPEPIPKSIICASKDSKKPQTTEYDNRLLEAFQKFWEIYPRKINKKAAEKAWMALFRSAPKSTHADLMRGVALHIDDYKDDIEERGTEERFIKHPATWLRAVDFLEPPIRGAV